MWVSILRVIMRQYVGIIPRILYNGRPLSSTGSTAHEKHDAPCVNKIHRQTAGGREFFCLSAQ